MKSGFKTVKFRVSASIPIGEYKDFDDCMNKNKQKDDPEVYCGEIMKRVKSILISTVLSKNPINGFCRFVVQRTKSAYTIL